MKESIIVFGCGHRFEQCRETLLQKYDIVCFIDNFKNGNLLVDGEVIPVYDVGRGVKLYPKYKYVVCSDDFISMAEQAVREGLNSEQIDFSQNYSPHCAPSSIWREGIRLKYDGNRFSITYSDRCYYFANSHELDEVKNKIEVAEQISQFPDATCNQIDRMLLEVPQLKSNERCIQNDFYRHAYWIKKYCGLHDDFVIRASIEHSCFM